MPQKRAHDALLLLKTQLAGVTVRESEEESSEARLDSLLVSSSLLS